MPSQCSSRTSLRRSGQISNPRINQSNKRVSFLLAIIGLAYIPNLLAGSEIDATNTPVTQNGQLIKNFPSKSNKDQSFQLFLPACTSSPCQIEVQLLSKQIIQDKQNLAWPADTQDIFTEKVGRWHGLGDPMDSSSQYTAWTIGGEYEGVSVVAQQVKLDENTDALLVVQIGGFEHIRRYHVLYTAQEQKLVKAWEQKETQGPTWATANPYLLPLSAQSKAQDMKQDIMYFSATQSSAIGGDFFDELTVSKLHWDNTSRRLEMITVALPQLFYIVTYPFKNQDNANEQLYRHRNCLDDSTLVLNGRSLFPATQSTAVLAAVTQNKQFADSALKKIKQCLPDKKVKIFTI